MTGVATEAEGPVGRDGRVDRVVVAGGRPEPEDVPVAGDVGFLFGNDGEHVIGRRAVGQGGERTAADPVGVLDAAPEVVRAGDGVRVAVGHGHAVWGELAGHQRRRAVTECLLDERIGQNAEK